MRMSAGMDRLTVRVAQYIGSDDELTLCRVAVKEWMSTLERDRLHEPGSHMTYAGVNSSTTGAT